MRCTSVLLFILVIAAPSGAVLAQNTPPADSAAVAPPDGTAMARRSLTAVRAAVRPVVDGRLDDAAWRNADAGTGFIQQEPEPGKPATERTEVRVVYDDDALYVAARLYDSRTDSIVAPLARRDQGGYSDWFFVAVDSYRDRRTAFAFGLNPRGVKRDVFLYDDTNDDASWDAVWDGAARIDSVGWTVEFRIPFSQLRFSLDAADEATGEGITWGLNFQREIARKRENSLWSPIPRDASAVVSRFGDLHGLAGLEPPRRLELQPYSVTRVTRAPGAAEDPFHRANDLLASVGADVRYGITTDLTLTATLNPDFGQVEADPSQVNLTAFETFLPERRPFFVEGANIFRFAIGLGDGGFGNEQLFYSRRIGRVPQGSTGDAAFSDVPDATTILGAAKLSGRTGGGWSLGLMSAVTGAEHARVAAAAGAEGSVPVEPLTNYSVARASRDFREGASAVGGVFTATNRSLDAPSLRFLRSAAYAGGVDARHRFGGGDYEVTGWLLGSHVRGSAESIDRTQRSSARYFQRPDAGHLEYDPTRTSLSGLAGSLLFHKIGGGHWRWGFAGTFRTPGLEVNDLGFQRSADQALQVLFGSYDQFEPGRRLRRWRVNASQAMLWTFGGERVVTELNANAFAQLHNLWSIHAGLNHNMGGLSPAALRGGPALVTPARTSFFGGFSTDSRKAVNAQLSGSGSVEHETGSRQVSIGPSINVRPSSRMELSLRPSISASTNAWQYVGRRDALDQPRYLFGRLERRTASLTTRLSYTFTPDLSLQFYAQPFISTGSYSDFMQVADPRAGRHAGRFDRFAADQLAYDADARRYSVDLDRDGAADLSFANPDFNIKELRTNAVLRWEYRPGSALFLVWSHGRAHEDPLTDGSLRLRRDADRLFAARPTNVLVLKASYWVGI